MKRTSKAAKRSSLTAMLGLSRKKSKDKNREEKEHESSHDTPASPHLLRPSPNRTDTHHTTRTSNTMLTTHTTATAGTAHSGASSGDRSSNHGVISVSPVDMAYVVEPSAKTLARAAATRDQLAKRYEMVYAGIEAATGTGESGGSSISSAESKAKAVGRGMNLLRVVRWRAANPGKSAHLAGGATHRPDFGNGGYGNSPGEVWERELERRTRGAPSPGYSSGGEYPPAGYSNSGYPAPLGDSLPEATSLSWLPYLEPVFAEERTGGETGSVPAGGAGGTGGMSAPVAMAGIAGMGAGGIASSENRSGPMTAWYVLASFVQAYVAAENAPPEPVPLPTIPASTVGEEAHPQVLGENTPARVATDLGSSPEGRARSTRSDTHGTTDPGLRFGIIDRALRTKSRQGSFISERRPGANRSRQSSVGMGATSEPPSPSHIAHPGLKGGPPWFIPRPTDTRAHRSYSGSVPHTHTRSNSKARSISAGNGTSAVDENGYLVKSARDTTKPMQAHALSPPMGDVKSMSPASSRMNLANFIIGGAAVLGLGLGTRRRPHRDSVGLGVSGSENESGRLSSDMSPSDGDIRMRARMRAERKGGLSDGEGGRVKRRKKTWRERDEGSGGKVPLSDGGADLDLDVKRRSWRLSTTVMVPVPVELEKEKEQAQKDRESEERKELDHARKRL